MPFIDPEGVNLADLSYVALEHLHALPRATGVYFVINAEGIPLYIGQAVSIQKRLLSHHHKKIFLQLSQGRIAWILAPYAELAALEVAMIALFKPPLNKVKGGRAKPITEAATYERFNVRLPPDVMVALRAKADKSGAPINTELILALRRGLRASKSATATASPALIAV